MNFSNDKTGDYSSSITFYDIDEDKKEKEKEEEEEDADKNNDDGHNNKITVRMAEINKVKNDAHYDGFYYDHNGSRIIKSNYNNNITVISTMKVITI